MASQALTRPSTRSGYAEPSNISRVPYLPGLDGMRALAVVAVMIYHANPEWLPGGFIGVEMFFVIRSAKRLRSSDQFIACRTRLSLKG